MVVVEAFLSSLFEVVLDKLVAAPLLDYARQLKVDTAVLQEWRNTLLHLQAVLHDAEQRQIRDEAVKRWLDDLKALAYDIEDVLDEFEAEAKRPSLVQGPQTSSSSSSGKVEVYGREGDREKIMKLLLSDEVATADKVQVIPIVGMGGVGKTTLAQIIYNDKRVGTSSISDSGCAYLISLTCLQKELNGKRFFLVLDDIWNENPDNWSTLQAPLKAGAQGSVIIATTRNEKVASIMGTTPFCRLSELSDEHCWSVFAYRAFENITPDAIKNLEPIGRKIIQKCKGLPLAAKTLGGLLRSEQDEKAWKEMMNNEIWDLPMEQSNILPALHLSYHYLPKKVKQCFAYCSIFLKDYEYQKEELILLWVAQGFVGGFKGEEMIEDGEKCFQNLLSREFCFRLEVGKQKNFSKRARHLSYNHEEFDVSKKFDPLHKHLRYLNLSSTKIQKLPKSIGMLCNLQSLMLSNCHGITELPSEIKNLIHLHHLDISGTKLEGMPTGINKLKDLRRLTTFVVGKHSGARIAELQDLSHLRGALSIFNLQNVVNATDALKANLKKKEDLDDLVFAWDSNVIDSDSENQTRVLENLQPHTKVKRLNIQHYYGTKFPKWLGDPSFMNLVFLQLEDCKSCSSLPPLGQLQSLKDLQIAKMDGVQNVGADFYGNNDCDSSSKKPFGSLEILRFEEMLEWEEWVCRGVEFPCLKELYIKKCPKLKKDLPKHLPKLTKLKISECGQLVCCLPMAPSIRELMLEECDDVVVRSASSLTSLASLDIRELKEIPPILHSLTSLKNLNIQQCESLASFPEMALPPMLERLEIIDCPTLESLPEGMMQNNTTLQHLSIEYCDSLRSLPRDIDSLKTLSIYGCKKLELALQEDMTHNHYASLTKFVISNCDSLTSFPLASFTKLETLHLWHCTNLESLYIPDGLHHMDLTSLQILNFYNCPNLKLKSLPQGMHSLLTSLERLRIEGCPEIDSFPIEGLPTNLSDLDIRNCNKLMACRMEWHLQTLPFLAG
ncbi:putative disease resistance RPP13-like protein 1 [Vitis vinifera]|uniref:Putative disease resistance RPP13-like protein 1 n=1 Tax=Vitis vinifera TaxID=29760 RepID=A0A438IU90_VITVI|nr:putative disease resistance RPP13-like protein 1 [Vitis vinifera]